MRHAFEQRSIHEAPGSPSSALQIRYFSSPGDLRQKPHFMPVGKPAAAAAAQAALAHFLDDRFGRQRRERLGQADRRPRATASSMRVGSTRPQWAKTLRVWPR